MWVNTQYFRESALYFERHGSYPFEKEKGSYDWERFWTQEIDRCLYGFSSSGRRITGKHYFYLNYLPIKKVITTKTGSKRRGMGFADFWDEDFRYWMSVEIAREGISLQELRKLPDMGIVETEENLKGGLHHLWLKPRGVGAEQPHSEILISPDGEITMGDVKPGTKLYDKYGNITSVTEVLPQGYKEVWEIELLDGRKVTCGENHLWTVETKIRNGKPEYKTLTTKELYSSGLFYNHSTGQKTYKYKIPELQPVKFEEKNLSIPPYVLGALLGDGTINGKNIKIASDDIEIVDKIINDLNIVWKNDYKAIKDKSNNNYTLCLKNKQKYINAFKDIYGENTKYGCNPLKRELELLKINVKCDNKFIPEIYKYSSVEQRLELVKGLMDTDGSISEKGYCEFTNKSEKLIDDLAYVLRSLGIYCKKGFSDRKRNQTIVSNNKSHSFVEEKYYRLYIATNQNIFNLKRKSDRINYKKRTRTSVPVINVKNTGILEKQSCIIVDNPEHLYLTRDFIITHNSFKGAVVPVYNQFFVPDSTSFIIADSKEYLLKDGIYSKYMDYRTWVNQNASGFKINFSKMAKDEMHFRASKIDSAGEESGMKSSVYGVVLEGDADKARGKRGDICWEEFGTFTDVAKAWEQARNSVEEYGITYAQMLGFGTGGDSKGRYESLDKMFNDPVTYNILAFKNIWDDVHLENTCAMFTPAYVNITDKDADGNSDTVMGMKKLDADREKAKNAKDPLVYPRFCAEKPYKPSEALLSVYDNIFPIDKIDARLSVVKSIANSVIVRGKFKTDDYGNPLFSVDNSLIPFTDYPVTQAGDKKGSFCIFKPPYRVKGIVPDNLYRLCCDPYRHDTTTGDSVGSYYIIENPNNLTGSGGDVIVAWYTGRPQLQATFNEQMFYAAQYYNCKIAFENDEPGGIVDYAKTHKKLWLLEPAFELAYDASLQSKNSHGTFGMRMGSGKLNLRKMQGDKYIEEWLLRVRGVQEDGKEITNIDFIYDIGLLNELKYYKTNGNFDRISAFRIGMYYERELAYKQRKVQIKKATSENYFNRDLFK